jgi:hypothetical protein
MDYDRSRLNAEIAEMEARRAAEARARQDALEREQRGPVYRGALTRIREGIKAGREELREQREAQKKMYRKYDEAHPSEIGKKLGRVVERAAPVTEAAVASTKKTISRAARATKQTLAASAKAARKAAQENQRRSRTTRGGRTTRSKPVRMRSGLDDMTRLDDLMPAPSRPKTQKKKKKSRRDDPFDLGGFRLM